MTTYAAIALATLWSVTFGYEPSADADVGYDYIVQVEPEMLEAMERGEAPAIEANLPPEVTPVRRVRIVVGKGELPKKLRSPVARTAMRPDIEADSAAMLLAQTGPAGVYGRTPTGFQNAPAGTNSSAAATSTPPSAGTVPPPETRYQPFSYANPTAGSVANTPAVGTGVQNTGSSQTGIVDHLGQAGNNLRGVANNIGQAGQQMIDTTRQALGQTITPPEYTGYDPQGRPLSNITERLQAEVRNTAEAFREPWERAATTPTANHVPNQANVAAQNSQQQPQGNNWVTTSNPAGTTGGAQPGPIGPPTYPNPPADYRNDRYAQEQSVLSQGQVYTASPNVQAPLLEAPSVGSHPGQYAPTQNRNPVDLNNWAATRDNSTSTQPTHQGNNPPRGYDGGTASVAGQQPSVSLPAGDAWQGNANHHTTNSAPPNPTAGVNPVSHTPGAGLPEVTSNQQASSPPASSGRSNDLAEFGTGGNAFDYNQSRETGETNAAGTGGATILNVMAWIIAAGAVAGNLFQWVSIVDLRNRYRVALRRNSPGFGRSMAA